MITLGVQQQQSRLRTELWPVLCFIAVFAYSIHASFEQWNAPLLGPHAFRQTQTAINVEYMLHDGPKLAYDRPLRGAPWSCPFEFPLFQWCVLATIAVTHLPLEQSGRLVSLLFFWLSLIPFYYALGMVRITSPQRFLILSMLVICPFYIFWSRTFMIESTAFFLSTAFIALIFLYYEKRDRALIFPLILVAALAGAVKIMTLFPFAFAAAMWFLATRFRKPFSERARSSGVLVLSIITAFAAGFAWDAFSSIIREQNPLQKAPDRISFLFGSVQQRFTWVTWKTIFWERLLHNDYHLLVFFLLVPALVLAKRRIGPIAASMFAFLIAPLVFTRLYFVHDYYAYANLAFLIVAMGLIMIALLECKGWQAVFGIVAFFTVISLSVYRHETDARYFIPQRQIQMARVAKIVEQNTVANDLILIYTPFDADPTIAYLAHRRALMILAQDAPTAVEAQITKMVTQYKIGALVAFDDSKQDIQARLSYLKMDPTPAMKIGDLTLYLYSYK